MLNKTLKEAGVALTLANAVSGHSAWPMGNEILESLSSAWNSAVAEVENLIDPVKGQPERPSSGNAMFDSLSSMWDSVDDEVENYSLKGETDWTMPKWGEGFFVTSGPSK